MLPSCYRRLKIFSGETTRAMGVKDGDPVASLDLDIVITGEIRSIFDLSEDFDFVAWRGIGTYRPVVYNGSLFMFRAGQLNWMWDDFDPEASPDQTREARYYGSDQAWMSYKLNGSKPGWDVEQGVYSYSRDVRGRMLPTNARIVSFNGKAKPWDAPVMGEAPWIKDHWKV
jgi:hypothetical protein